MAITDAEVDYIDKKNKTIHLKDGRSEPLSEEAAYSLFESKGAKRIREGHRQAVKDTADFSGGEGSFAFLRNIGDNIASKALTEYVVDPLVAGARAISPGEGQEEMGFFSRLYENLNAKNRGEREARQGIEERNPKSALAGSIGSLGIDLALPLPKSLGRYPVATGAGFGALSGKPIYEDPKEALTNAAIGGGIGYGVGRLQNIAAQRAALREHPQAVQRVGEANQKAQVAFEKAMETKLSGLEKNLPKEGLGKNSLNIPGFINAEINVSPLAGSSEAKSLINFFETIEKGLPQAIKEGDIKKLFNVIESKLATASQEQLPFLTRFREHMVEVLPIRIGQGIAKDKLLPKIIKDYQKGLSKSIDAITNDAAFVKALQESPQNKNILKGFKERVFKHVEDQMNLIPPEVLADAYEKGTLNQLLSKSLSSSKDFYTLNNEVQNLMGKLSQFGNAATASPTYQAYKNASGYIQKLKNDAIAAANQAISNRSDFSMVINEAAEKAASKISNAVGVKNPFISRNISPTNLRPTPMPPPAPPQVGALATAFENPNFYKNTAKTFGGVKGGIGGFLAAKALGLGNAAVGAGGIAGLTALARGASRPDMLGQINRQVLQRGGIEAIVSAISEKPSYSNGILLDPQDRRDAVAEVENDPDLSLGDKALLQAKINRGVSLEKLLEQYRM